MNNKPSPNDIDDRQSILSDIEKFGCRLTSIEPTNYLPGFVYSIGFWQKYGQPEIICFGLKTEMTASIINHAGDLIKNNEPLIPGKLYNGFLQGYSIQFIEVDKAFYRDYFGYGGWFYDNFDFPALQIVWPDKQHKFPWEEDFNPDWKFKQPLLDRDTGFKFYEEKNLAVATTKQALEGEPILYAYHSTDGDWQFHTGINPDPADIKLVSLAQIVALDPSLNEIHYLEYGKNAWRSGRYDDWQFSEDEGATGNGDIPGDRSEELLELNDLIKDITKIDVQDITSEWDWLIAGYKKVLMVTKFGDMFFVGTNDEVIWLDTGAGKLTPVASSDIEFGEILKEPGKNATWFFPDLYLELLERQILLQENEVYSFQKLPLMGGQYTIDNIKPTDMSVHFGINGQICRQLKNIPDGTKVKITVAEPKKKPWWKF